MFPGIDGFHWTVGHVIFLSLFFAVVATILATLVFAGLRTKRDFRTDRAIELCWKSDFAELPESERRCRHELAGRGGLSRTCDNALIAAGAGNTLSLPCCRTGLTRDLGLHYPEDRLYHRGHTWVKPAEDGTFTVGLDELADHLVGRARLHRVAEGRLGNRAQSDRMAYEEKWQRDRRACAHRGNDCCRGRLGTRLVS